jgi:hypothetical protein
MTNSHTHTFVILTDNQGWLITSHGDEPWPPGGLAGCPVQKYLATTRLFLQPGHWSGHIVLDAQGEPGGLGYQRAPVKPIPANVQANHREQITRIMNRMGKATP